MEPLRPEWADRSQPPTSVRGSAGTAAVCSPRPWVLTVRAGWAHLAWLLLKLCGPRNRKAVPKKIEKVPDLRSDGGMATIHAFGPFRLDADAETLFRGSEPLPVGKRAVALLRVLVERAGAPVSKDTLIDTAWSGLAVEESNLTVQIAALRRALGEVPGGEDWIVTLPRRGYRFVGPVVTKGEAQVPAAPMDLRQSHHPRWLPLCLTSHPSQCCRSRT
jgi:DNA-binding winged helix-turn-helix (wHTH) protein